MKQQINNKKQLEVRAVVGRLAKHNHVTSPPTQLHVFPPSSSLA